MRKNTLNELTSKEWLKFQKSWFLHNPPPRRKHVLVHPAKFPETLVQEFIEFFTKSGMNVLDPMLGTGSTLIACIRSGRNGYGVELNEKYAQIARKVVNREIAAEGIFRSDHVAKVICGDARDLETFGIPPIDYCITSPPYWDMLKMKGAQTQKNRKDLGLDLAYSEDPKDLGNIGDYDLFLDTLASILRKAMTLMRHGAYLTVIVKNVKKKGRIYPLAWDLGKAVGEFLTLKDEKIWVQDNQRLSPYGLGSAWVSNTFHHYCLNFRREK